MRPIHIAYWLTALLPAVKALSVEKSKEFPLGTEIENLALRPNGNVLAISYTNPPANIYEVSVAANSTPNLIYTFQNASGISSIVQSTTPDLYYLVTGNFSFKTLAPTPKSYAIHTLSFDECNKPIVKKLASLETLMQPNGITIIPNTPYVLIADTRAGYVYSFNTKTLELSIYLDDPLLKPTGVGDIFFGVNGIKLSRGYFYFSNTNQQILARVKVFGRNASIIGSPEIVGEEAPCDDFILNDYNGDIYLAENGATNALAFLGNGPKPAVPEILYGGPNSTDLLFPTAAIWAKGAVGKTLIVSSNGDEAQFATGNYTGGAKLNFVHLD